ncbi:MAG TPA: hypothetical protein VHX90_01150 [Verrucomicrobiae bacterium]|jgi:hypothetical protein|nr:hypothetical protein [Verrucomicrobiae bacterium]
MHTESMPLVVIWMMVGIGIYFIVIIAALLIHGIWLAPFIERHGKRSAGFFVFGMLPGVGLVKDYLAARQICRERNINPRWMWWFALLLIAAGVFAALIIGFILFSFLHK